MKKSFNTFLVLWVGQFVSLLGSGLTVFALGVYTFEQTGQASSYAWLLLCFFLPPFLLKPIGGVLADRYDRRLLMLWSDLGATLGLLFVFLQFLDGDASLWQILLGVTISSCFSAFQEPAYKASVTDLIPADEYQKASGLVQLAGVAQYLVSPFLAALILEKMSIEYIFFIDISTFVCSVLAIAFVKNLLPAQRETSTKRLGFWVELVDGLQVIKKQRGIFLLTGLITLVMFFVGVLQTLYAPLLLSLTTQHTLGVSQSLSASGMLIGSLGISLVGSRVTKVRSLAVGLLGCGVFFAGMGISTSIPMITLMGFLFFATLPLVNTSIEVLIRTTIHNKEQGRAWANISTITFSGSIVAFILSGVLADQLFNPWLRQGGALSQSIGLLIGVGEGRGIGLMLILSGLMIVLLGTLAWRSRQLLALESGSNVIKRI